MVLGAFFALVLVAWFSVDPFRGFTFHSPRYFGISTTSVGHDEASVALPLHGDRADALFELLKPAYVKVLVARRGDGVTVQGTPGELRALHELAGLVSRPDSPQVDELRYPVHHHRAGRLERREFRLPQDSAEALNRILDFAGVPVFVKRERTRIEVQASDEDMHVIESVVRILRGERL